jgi:glycosyltransferase involved in cell wall biosynthesis
MASSVPVVASASGGILEIIDQDKNGFLFPEKDTKAICEVIIYVYSHPDKVRNILEKAYSTVNDKFSLHAMVTKVESILSEEKSGC